MVEVIYCVAASLDGFIAPPDGSADWLSPFMLPGDDYGLAEFEASVSAFLMGSRTYEQTLAHGGGGLAAKPCYVFSSRQLPVSGPHVTITTASPQEVVAELERRGITRAWLFGGARLLTSFREAGLVTEYSLGIAPVVLGGGVPLFESPGPPAQLRLVESKAHPNGVLGLRYQVVPPTKPRSQKGGRAQRARRS
jgi:dihydrofolate reductase